MTIEAQAPRSRARGSEWLRVREAADLLGVSPNTLRRAEDAGVVSCVRSPGGHRRYRRRDLEVLLAAGGLRRRAPGTPARNASSAKAGARQVFAGAAVRQATAASNDDLSRQVAVLSAKVELAQEMNRLLAADPEQLLAAIARRLAQLSVCPICTIYAYEGDRLRVLVSVEDGVNDEIWEARLYEPSFWPPAAEALRSREPRVVADVSDPAVPAVTRAAMIEWGCASTLTIPLVVEGNTIGLVELSDRVPRDFGDELPLAHDLARTAAHAIGNARLLQRVEHNNTVLAALVELGAFIAQTNDLETVAHTVTKRLRDVVGVACCEIYLIENGRLRLISGHDEAPYGESWLGWSDDLSRYPTSAAAVASGEILVVSTPDDPRLTDFERTRFRDYGLVSEINVPLIVGEHAVGMLDLFDERPRDFADHVDFLRSVGQLVAGHLQNALLVDRLQGSARDLQLLVDSSLDFGSSLEFDDVIATIAARMATVAHAQSCDIYAIHGDDMQALLCYENDHLLEGFAGQSYPWREFSFCRRAVETGEPAACSDILSDADASVRDREYAAEMHYRAELNLPLVARGNLVGMASLFATEPREFAQLELLRGLATMAAQALANASLYRELDRSAQRMGLVAGSSMELSASLDLDSVLNNVARSLSAVSGFVDCDVYRVHEDRVECVVSLIHGEVCREWLGQTRTFREWPIMRRAVTEGKPIGVSSPSDPVLAERERREMIAWGEKATLIVPLLAKDQVVATVELSDTEHERSFDAEELATVEAISRVAGVAIDNAMLYDDIKQMHVSNLKALSSALNAKDYYTLGHAARVAAYMVLLGKELGWSPELVHGIEEAAYLHDIGKIGVSDRILLKPGGLNAREWELMRQHPVFSADIIKPLFPPELVLGVRHHHERYDGAGYPEGLAGDDIPEIARAMCVVDSYDAMSFRRPYRQALSYSECRAELLRCRGQQFDPRMTDAFLRMLGRLQELKATAEAVAEQAAARIDTDKHALLRSRDDESRPEYEELRSVLRAVRDANPPTRYLTSRAVVDDKHIIVVDPEEDAEHCSHVGDEVFADEELPAAYSGLRSNTNVLYVDEFGVWMTGLAPVRDARGEVTAVVAADMPPPETQEEEMEGLRSDVTQTFASMLKSAGSRLSRAELDAITDGLTGLYNHRYLHERLSEEVERAREQAVPLALLFCDLDNFKAFNDAYGHSVGDGALRAVARAVESCLRHVDMAARYGGEEFAIVLVETSREGAVEVAERIRKAIAAIDLDIAGAKLSVSIGVGVFPDDAGGKAELLDKADWAMYLAKRHGRDQVAAFADGQLRLPFV